MADVVDHNILLPKPPEPAPWHTPGNGTLTLEIRVGADGAGIPLVQEPHQRQEPELRKLAQEPGRQTNHPLEQELRRMQGRARAGQRLAPEPGHRTTLQ